MKSADRIARRLAAALPGLPLPLILLVCVALDPSRAMAQENDYIGPNFGSWNAATSYWSLGHVPGNGEDAVLGHQAGGTDDLNVSFNGIYAAPLNSLKLDSTGLIGWMNLNQTGGSMYAVWEYVGFGVVENAYNQSAGTNTAQNLYLGFNSAASGNYSLTGSASLTVNGLDVIGNFGTGAFSQGTGTTHTIAGQLDLGRVANSSGTYTMTGGALWQSANNITQTIGDNATGIFNQSGGTASFNALLVLGASSNANGAYNLSGNGQLSANNSLIIGQSGSGTFSQTGANSQVTVVGEMMLALSGNSSGLYTLSGGHLSTSDRSIVGEGGIAIFTQSGGTYSPSGLDVGETSTGQGTYNLSGTGVLNENGAVYIGDHGRGTFNQTGGTHNVGNNTLNVGSAFAIMGVYNLSGGALNANVIQLNANGTFNQTGGTLNVANFNQNGGTVTGVLQNQGTFTYSSGAFNGRLLNQGTVVLNADFTVGNGMENDATFTLSAGRTISLNGAGLDNEGAIILAGGTLAGSGPLTNNGVISGYGTLGGSAGLTNNVQITQSGGNLVVAGTGWTNHGNIDLAAGYQLKFSDVNASLYNLGTFNLNGSIVQGAGTLYNGFGGTIAGRGSILSPFTNAGILAVSSGTTYVSTAFNNSGLVQLSSDTASLGGGAISNSGTIQGMGNVGNDISNDGTIEALGGTLSLSGHVANNGDGLLTATAGNKLLVIRGLMPNSGVINLAGGTFDNNAQALTNYGQISGYGVFRAGSITNGNGNGAGSMTIAGGTTTSVNGDVTNAAKSNLTVSYTTAVFTGNVVNFGNVSIHKSSVTFAGSYTENGTYHSDPSDSYFAGVSISAGGSWSAGAGDRFFITGDLVNNSTQIAPWNTSAAELHFIGGGAHMLSVAAPVNAQGWGTLSVDGGDTLNVSGNSATAANTINNGVINQTAPAANLGAISGAGSVSVAANAALNALFVRQNSLSVAGKLAIAPRSAGGGVSAVQSLSISGAGQVDLSDTALTVAGGDLTAINNMVKSGYHGGAWNGQGIITSSYHATVQFAGDKAPWTTLGVFLSGSDVVVKYTYQGDVDGNGVVNAADFAQIKYGSLNQVNGTIAGRALAYSDGDVDYNGVINAADFAMTKSASLNQGGALGLVVPKNVNVPEPGVIGILAIGAIGVLKRRKRN